MDITETETEMELSYYKNEKMIKKNEYLVKPSTYLLLEIRDLVYTVEYLQRRLNKIKTGHYSDV